MHNRMINASYLHVKLKKELDSKKVMESRALFETAGSSYRGTDRTISCFFG